METATTIQVNERPWQGTVLGIFQILGLVATGILTLVFIFGAGLIGSVIENMAQNSSLPIGVISSTALILIGLILFLPITVLTVFVTIGVFKGKKWAIIIALIFTGLNILTGLFTFSIFSLAISGFLLYCEIICLKDPFYNNQMVPGVI